TTKKLVSFNTQLNNWLQMSEYLSVTELVEQLLNETGYLEMLKKDSTIEGRSRLENMEEFLSVTKDFEAKNDDKSLVAFLTDLALISTVDDVEDTEKKEHVRLMTLHAAKGLEFPIVFL